jgi:hypothetical protein
MILAVGPGTPLRYAGGITMIRLRMSIPTITMMMGPKVTTKAVIAMTAWHACQILRVMTMIMMTDPRVTTKAAIAITVRHA